MPSLLLQGSTEEIRANLLCRVGHPSRWQRIIHGPTDELRRYVVKHLVDREEYKVAERYVFCGTADTVWRVGGEYAYRMKRCGHRLCPRCSRYLGYKYCNRIEGHLRREGHGHLYHLVFTQTVSTDETVEQARMRMEGKYQKVLGLLRRSGMTAGLSTVHVPYSALGGWHYHMHFVVELTSDYSDSEADAVVRKVRSLWESMFDFGRTWHHDECWFQRCVGRPQGPRTELPEGEQAEFFTESKDPATRCLQYVVRDVVQGVERWLKNDPATRVAELVDGIEGCHLHRCYGRWRKPAPEETVATSENSEEAEEFGSCCGQELGRVDDFLGRVEYVDEDGDSVLRWLSTYFGLHSPVAVRLRAALAVVGM